jgi:hypothetical protein
VLPSLQILFQDSNKIGVADQSAADTIKQDCVSPRLAAMARVPGCNARRFPWPEPAGRVGQVRAHIAPSEYGVATQPHFIRGPDGRPLRLHGSLYGLTIVSRTRLAQPSLRA